ncbi:MAG: MFS transporter [Candidatus Wildermuthbacteria bacterium]|nr:MFS transporter [Candidatus Wildermuthbacteria bacterium]
MLTTVILVLVASDFLLQAGWGLIAPIFAIFLSQQIAGGSIAIVGFIAAAYWMSKSFVQPFIAHVLDLKKGEKDDFKILVIGMYAANLVPLGYFFSTELWHIFLLEIVRGLAMAMVVPTWSGIFTRHIRKGWEAFSWSIESTSIGFAAGFAAAFGGIIASAFGFQIVFLLVTCMGLLSSTLLLVIRNKIFPKEEVVRQALHPREGFRS